LGAIRISTEGSLGDHSTEITCTEDGHNDAVLKAIMWLIGIVEFKE